MPISTKPSRRPVKPQTPAPDPLRRGNIALLAVLEGLPDATVGADARRPDRVRQRARRAAVRLRPQGADRAADRDPVAGARARPLQAQPGALLRARSPAALHRARLRAAQGRHRVHRRDELGHRGERRRPAAAGDRPQHLRAPRDRAAAAPAVRAAGRGRRARRARAARRRPRGAHQGGDRAGAAVLGAERVEVLDGPREIAAWGALERAASKISVPIHTGDRVHGALVGGVVDGGRVRRGGGLVPAGGRQRAGGRLLAPARSRSRCASRRSTTR